MTALRELERLEDRISEEQSKVESEYLAFCVGLIEAGEGEGAEAPGVEVIRTEIQKAGKTMGDLKQDLKRLEYRRAATARFDYASELEQTIPGLEEERNKLRDGFNAFYDQRMFEIFKEREKDKDMLKEILQKRREVSDTRRSANSVLADTAGDGETFKGSDWRNAALLGVLHVDPDDPNFGLPVI